MNVPDPPRPPLSPLYRVAGFVLVFWACALLNGVGGYFQIIGGVSFVYPASAAAVLGGVFLGWWGAVAAFLGYVASPWGIAQQGLNSIILSVIGALQAILPAVVPLPERGSSFVRIRRFFLYGVVANTLISAILGVGFVAHWTSSPIFSRAMISAFLGWFLGDAVAISLLAVPFILLVRPQILVDEDEIETFRHWLFQWRHHLILAGVILLDGTLMELTATGGYINIHWLGGLLVGPVLVAATLGGTGAGLMVSGVAGLVYVVQVLRLVNVNSEAALLGEMLSAYFTMTALTLAAIVAGGYAARTRSLVEVLDGHRGRLQRSFESAVAVLAAAIEAKDPTTEGHVQRVARLAVRVGRVLGLSGQRLEILRYAAMLHDIGKIQIPETILNKPGELDESEREKMEAHVSMGIDILQDIELLKPAIPFIQYHQERWDGKTSGRFPGYFGLKGEEIPLEARIIAAVDAFDAMTNDRPYRKAMPLEEAVEEIRREAGKQFDPDVARALLQVVTLPTDTESSTRWPVLDLPAKKWGILPRVP